MRFGCEVNLGENEAPFLCADGDPYDLIASAGFDTTDVSAAVVARATTERASRSGLEFVCYHSDFLAPERAAQDNGAIQEHHMQNAGALRCLLFLVHSLWIDWKPFDFASTGQWKRYLDFDISNLQEIGRRCRGHHLRFVIENNPLFPLRYYVELLSNIPPENAGMCLDVGHANIQVPGHETPLTDWIHALGDRIEHLHLHDNDGVKDLHLPILAPGGTVDWKSCFQALKAVDYHGIIHEELPPMTGVRFTRWALLERGSRPIRELWASS